MRLKLPDAIILGTAIARDCPLLTNDAESLRRAPEVCRPVPLRSKS